jgi:hypothetical protein
MVEDSSETVGKLTHDSITEVEKGIQHGVYPQNLKACGKIYGQPCPYINYCWNNDKKNLEVKQETKTEGETNE